VGGKILHSLFAHKSAGPVEDNVIVPVRHEGITPNIKLLETSFFKSKTGTVK
jgi:hypothetical protein